MSVHASRLKLPVCEIELDYGRRPEGSHSKLSTFKDGFKILWMFAMLMKETRPFAFFRPDCGSLMGVSLGFMAPVLYEFFTTGLVSRMPTWIAAMALMMMSFLSFTAALILDSVAAFRAEQLRIHYLTLPALNTSRGAPKHRTRPKNRSASVRPRLRARANRPARHEEVPALRHRRRHRLPCRCRRALAVPHLHANRAASSPYRRDCGCHDDDMAAQPPFHLRGASKRSMVSEGFRYGFIGAVTSLINYGVYALHLIGAPLLSSLCRAGLCVHRGDAVQLLRLFALRLSPLTEKLRLTPLPSRPCPQHDRSHRSASGLPSNFPV